MIKFNYNEYEKILNEIVYYFNPIKVEQLILILKKYFKDVDETKANLILLEYQNKGYIMLSNDGWAMTKGKYVQITGDANYEKVKYDSNERIRDVDYYVVNNCDMKLIKCLWVLIDMLPSSLDFVLTNKPFQLTFFNKKKELFQVIYIGQDEEDLRIEMLKQLPNDYFEDSKELIKRVAIMENTSHSWKIPEHIGFKYIVGLNDDTPTHYEIVEKRKEHW